MIHTTTLLLVLALAGSPAATTLCIGWCDAEAAFGGTAATCHHRTTSEGMPGIQAAEHGCDTRLKAEPFVREDAQRTASGSAVDHVVVFVGHLLAAPTPEAAYGALFATASVPRATHATVLRI